VDRLPDLSEEALSMPGHSAQNGQASPSVEPVANRSWRISLDGQDLPAREGQTVAAALLAAGHRVFRHTGREGEPRGLFCGMGICFDCIMQIDGRPNLRACQVLVRDGMRVTTQSGEGAWEANP
jgi:predicted molibdopterin-dependent oxidoreductase YjgC